LLVIARFLLGRNPAGLPVTAGNGGSSVGDIHLVFVCRDLPPGEALRLGIQRGTVVIDDVLGEGDEIPFSFSVTVRPRQGGIDFGGPFVQGRPGERFVYLCWGTRDEAGGWEMERRAKIPLVGITPAQAETAGRTGQPIEAALEMTDARGRPVCASYPPDRIAWRVAKQPGV
jgi:hypothetical protein